jgi:hypothetical protein
MTNSLVTGGASHGASSLSTKGQTGGCDSSAVRHKIHGGPGIRSCQGGRASDSVAFLSLALRSALNTLGASTATAARWCDVDARTVKRWLAGDTPVSLAAVRRSARLWPVFLDELRSATLERTGT